MPEMKRSQVEIVFAILSILREGPVNYSAIHEKVRLSGTQMTRYATLLKARELMTAQDSQWRISPKGADYCQSYERLQTYLQ